MVKPGRRALTNPFNDLDKLNDSTDLRKQRRALEPEQFATLVAAATNSGRSFRGLSGVDRAMIYTLAAYTGLRAGEIGSLKTNCFNFGDTPTVSVLPSETKNSKPALIPLRTDLAHRLAQYLQDRPRATLSFNQTHETVWPGTWSEKGVLMIKADLRAAGIPCTDQDGKDYDFHALRHQFITELSRAGVSLKAAQELARHSKPELTANVYTHLTIRNTAADVKKMGPIPTWIDHQQVATGTNDQFLSKHMAKQGLTKRDKSGRKGNSPVITRHEKKPSKNRAFISDADGTRTRNLRIDSPGL